MAHAYTIYVSPPQNVAHNSVLWDPRKVTEVNSIGEARVLCGTWESWHILGKQTNHVSEFDPISMCMESDHCSSCGSIGLFTWVWSQRELWDGI